MDGTSYPGPAFGPPGQTESSSPSHMVWMQVTPVPHDCEQVSKPPEYVPSSDYSDFIDVNGNAD